MSLIPCNTKTPMLLALALLLCLPGVTASRRDSAGPRLASVHAEISRLRAVRFGSEIVVDWETLSETGNRGFEVHRACSESRGWQNRGFVQGGFDGRSTREYRFVDRGVPPEDVRYMLRILGHDGMIQYSQIITVPVKGILRSFVVSPAPEDATSAASITVDLEKDDVITLQLADDRDNIIERIVSDKQLPSGRHDFTIDGDRLPSGSYDILLFTSEGRFRRSYEHRK
jgi:hypothetical protein